MNIRDFHRAAIAQQYLFGESIWDGEGADDNWSTPLNWYTNTKPRDADNLVFGGTTRLSPVNDLTAPQFVNTKNITFPNDAGAFNISGNQITLINASSITNDSSNIQTIANNIALSTGSSGIIINCISANVVLSGLISGSNGLIKNGASTLTLSNGSNSYSISTVINAGTIKLGNIAPLGTGNLILAGTGILDLNGYAYTFPITTNNTSNNKVINSGTDIIPPTEADRYNATNYVKLKGSTYNLQFNDTDYPSIGKISLLCGQGATSATLANTGNKIRGRVWLQGGTTTIASSLATFGTVSLLIGNGSTTPVLVYNGTTATTIGPRDIQMGLGGSATIGGGATIKNNGNGAVTLYGAYAEDNTATKKLTLGGSNTGENTIGGTGTIIRNATTAGVVSVEKVDDGKWVINGSNTYTGGTVVSGGTLKIGHKNALGFGLLTLSANTILDLNGTTLHNFGSTSEYANISSVASSTIINSGSSISTAREDCLSPEEGTINAKFDDTTSPSIGSISLRLGHQGAKVTLTNTGNKIRGKVYLTGTSTTTVANMNYGSFGTGDLESGNFTTSQILIYAGADADSTFGISGSTIRDIYLTTTNSSIAPPTFGGGLTIKNNANHILILDGVYPNSAGGVKSLILGGTNTGSNSIGRAGAALSAAGTIRDTAPNGVIALSKIEAGKWILKGANSYTGATTISGGTLQIGQTNAIPSSSNVIVTGFGVTLALDTVSSTCGTVSLKANGSITGTTGVLTGTSYSMEYGTVSAILGGSGALTKSTASTVILSGINTYSGGTTINDGLLDLSGKLASSSVLNLNGGTLQYTNASTQTFTATNLDKGASVIRSTVSNANVILQLGALTVSDGASINLGPANTIITTSTLNDANGILGGYATFDGYSTWAISKGSTTAIVGIPSGTLQYTITSVAANIPANYGAKHISVDSSQTPTGAITPATIRFSTFGAFALTLSNGSQLKSNGILVTTVVGANTSTITGGTLSTSVADRTLYIAQNNTSPLIIGSVIANNGVTSLSKSAQGTLILTAANTYTGLTTISGPATSIIALSGANRLPVTNGVVLNASAKLVLGTSTSTASQTLTSLITNLSGSVTGGNAANSTLTLNIATSNTFAGTLGGTLTNENNLALVKIGAGTLTLTGNNTYTGTTTIDDGILIVTKGIATATFTKVPSSSNFNLSVNFSSEPPANSTHRFFQGITSNSVNSLTVAVNNVVTARTVSYNTSNSTLTII